jgi:hypothetical protein
MKWLSNQTQWSEVDRTEVVMDSLDPTWQQNFDVVFNFGQYLQMRFEVNHVEADGHPCQIGFYEISLSEVITKTSGKKMLECDLMGSHAPNAGCLMIGAEEKRSARKKIKLTLAVENLPSCHNIFQCNFSTTYLMEIYRGKRGTNNVKFWESEYFVDEFDYKFQEMEFTD